jgi:hypothetical protein
VLLPHCASSVFHYLLACHRALASIVLARELSFVAQPFPALSPRCARAGLARKGELFKTVKFAWERETKRKTSRRPFN